MAFRLTRAEVGEMRMPEMQEITDSLISHIAAGTVIAVWSSLQNPTAAIFTYTINGVARRILVDDILVPNISSLLKRVGVSNFERGHPLMRLFGENYDLRDGLALSSTRLFSSEIYETTTAASKLVIPEGLYSEGINEWLFPKNQPFALDLKSIVFENGLHLLSDFAIKKIRSLFP